MNLEEITILAGNNEIFKSRANSLDRQDLALLKKVVEGQIVALKEQMEAIHGSRFSTENIELYDRKNYILKKKRELITLVDGYLAAAKAKDRAEQAEIRRRAAERKDRQSQPDHYLLYFHQIAKASLPTSQYEQFRQAATDRVELEKQEQYG